MRAALLMFLMLMASGCVSGRSPSDAMVLDTSQHTLWVWCHYDEGEVGCSHLTGRLLDKASRQTTKLRGQTYMVMCADGVTPCHVGLYHLSGRHIALDAYPNGALELTLDGRRLSPEHGQWVE